MWVFNYILKRVPHTIAELSDYDCVTRKNMNVFFLLTIEFVNYFTDCICEWTLAATKNQQKIDRIFNFSLEKFINRKLPTN